jgi:xylulokinase
VEPSRAVAVGGGAQNRLLLQIVSDITGMEQELPLRTIGAAYGDAFLAGRAVGLVTPDELRADHPSRWVQITDRIIPDRDRRALYQEYYRIYRSLYPKTREEMHALARLQGAVP